MIGSLTRTERQNAFAISIAVLLGGLAMATLGAGDGMGAQGWVVIFFAAIVCAVIMGGLDGPEPVDDRTVSY